MVETKTGHNRSNGISYNDLLKGDAVPPPAVYLEDSPMEPGVTRVPVESYYSREAHDLEVERLWKRVWQMACHESDIPNVGDTHVYDIASLSYIVVRVSEDEVKAFPNACLHRGRALCDNHRKELKVFRCPFHGWSWNLDGSLKEIPGHWDFPSVTEEEYSLQEVRVGHWGGFVFINPDPNCEPLEDFLGDIDRHFRIPFKRRYKAAHLIKRLPCNWKVAQEAFMESYHVVATHPELLGSFGDVNSKYDVFGNMSRAMSPSGPPSPHTGLENPDMSVYPDGKAFQSVKHLLSGHVYRRIEDDLVEVTTPNGKTGRFTSAAEYVEGEVKSADIQMCSWVGGKICPGEEDTPMLYDTSSPHGYRRANAKQRREQLRPAFGDYVDTISDADLNDSIYYSVFPNISPWADFNPIFYRFRPDGDNPEQSLHEVMYMIPVPEGVEPPPPAKCTFLDIDDDYTLAPEFGSRLLKIFNQDYVNHRMVQKGLHTHPKGETIYASYQEQKIRHFHETLAKWLESDEAPKTAAAPKKPAQRRAG
ncbi:MAG: aromatic ring-hydroxylating dioxygenase subunit alpha [Gammaproteobacteria bacterium]|nr:aromatic ring-hydroxylating dioxygenase subunit alpha [Gammaproteobacteria bacterium]